MSASAILPHRIPLRVHYVSAVCSTSKGARYTVLNFLLRSLCSRLVLASCLRQPHNGLCKSLLCNRVLEFARSPMLHSLHINHELVTRLPYVSSVTSPYPRQHVLKSMRDRLGQKSKLLPQYYLFFNKSQQFLLIAIQLLDIVGNSWLLLAICNNAQTQLPQIAAIRCNSSSCHFGNSILLDLPIFSPSKTLLRYSTIINICQQSPSLQPSPGPNNIQQLLTISQGHGQHGIMHSNMTQRQSSKV